MRATINTNSVAKIAALLSLKLRDILSRSPSENRGEEICTKMYTFARLVIGLVIHKNRTTIIPANATGTSSFI